MNPSKLFRYSACCLLGTALLLLPSTGLAAKDKPKKKKPGFGIPAVEKKDSICFAMYTVQNNTLKLVAQLYPLADRDSRDILLEIKINGKWKTADKTTIREDEYTSPKDTKAWNALFRVEKWNHSRDWEYRVSALDGLATYTGTIRKDPRDKTEIVVADFKGD